MLAGPFTNFDDYRQWCETAAVSTDPQHFAIIDLSTDTPIGTASYLRIDPVNGVRSRSATSNIRRSCSARRSRPEVMFLMMRRAFDELGYRRYEWKCDNLNEPSKRAAKRLGFQFEGMFRQCRVYKDRSRDTAWFSIIDCGMAEAARAYEAGSRRRISRAMASQKEKLGALIEKARCSSRDGVLSSSASVTGSEHVSPRQTIGRGAFRRRRVLPAPDGLTEAATDSSRVSTTLRYVQATSVRRETAPRRRRPAIDDLRVDGPRRMSSALSIDSVRTGFRRLGASGRTAASASVAQRCRSPVRRQRRTRLCAIRPL